MGSLYMKALPPCDDHSYIQAVCHHLHNMVLRYALDLILPDYYGNPEAGVMDAEQIDISSYANK